MSNILPTRPRQTTQRRSYAIVASQYNPDYVRGLVDNARKELETIAPSTPVNVYEVPGAFEIPLMVHTVAEQGGVDAIIALGVIIRGETDHADLIAGTITDSLQQASIKYRIPVIHEVLLVASEEQAKARCLDEKKNRGIEAARIAIRMAQALTEAKVR